jgi:ribosome-associated protein
MQASDDDQIEPDEHGYGKPSRSSRKRQAEALQKLGVRLVELKAAELAALSLPEALVAAVHEAQRLRDRGALARQRQYIGKLMRDVDPEPIEQALAARAFNPLHRAKVPR